MDELISEKKLEQVTGGLEDPGYMVPPRNPEGAEHKYKCTNPDCYWEQVFFGRSGYRICPVCGSGIVKEY